MGGLNHFGTLVKILDPGEAKVENINSQTDFLGGILNDRKR